MWHIVIVPSIIGNMPMIFDEKPVMDKIDACKN